MPDEERYDSSRFKDTIVRTIFIMVVAVVVTRVLDFPLWMTVVAVAAGIPVIAHATIWLRRNDSDGSEEENIEDIQ